MPNHLTAPSSLIGGREHFPAGRDAVDGSGNAGKGRELHHDFDEFLTCHAAAQRAANVGAQLRRCGSQRCQGGDGDDLPRARVERRALVDFAVDRFEYIGCELRSHIIQRSLDLFRVCPRISPIFCAPRARR
jgi:hypothetical protein